MSGLVLRGPLAELQDAVQEAGGEIDLADLEIDTARVYLPLLANEIPGVGPVRYKGIWGGRGSGKSQFFASLWFEENIAEAMDVVCLREVQKSLEFSVKRELTAVIERYNAGEYFEVQDKRILTKRGGVTIFEGMQNHTADSIKSLANFSRAWVEEAQALSHISLETLRPTLRRDDSQIWFSWNPRFETDAVDQFLRRKDGNIPKDAIVINANWQDNPWFPRVLRNEMEHDKRASSHAKYAHIWLGAYRKADDALVFRRWKVEEFDTHTEAVFRYGADWGYSIDPSVLIRCYLIGRKLYVDWEAYEVGCEIDQLPALFMQVPEAERWPITADSARPETIGYMKRHGFPRMTAAVKGAGSVEEGVEWLQSLEIIVHPRCTHTIDELSTYAYKVDKLTGKPIPRLEDADNHVIDALRYACEGARRAARAGGGEVYSPDLPGSIAG